MQGALAHAITSDPEPPCDNVKVDVELTMPAATGVAPPQAVLLERPKMIPDAPNFDV
jgi:hypothetical protein